MAKLCPKCGNEIGDEKSNFCNKCGTQLPSLPPSELKLREKSQKPEPKKQWLFNFLGIKKDSDTSNLDFRFGIDIIDNSLNRIEKKIYLNRIEKDKPLKDISPELDVIVGILIILALYILPIKSFGGRNFSIADLTSICNSPMGIMMGGSDCNVWNMVFYGGWAIGIVGIIFGVVKYSKKK